MLRLFFLGLVTGLLVGYLQSREKHCDRVPLWVTNVLVRCEEDYVHCREQLLNRLER